MKPILDACCGSRMFWFDKADRRAVFADNRQFEDTLCDGRTLTVNPDVVADFRDMPFPGNSFSLVVFDPPHLVRAGDTSWVAKKYGRLGENWKSDLRQGFAECFRVLKPNGTLIFKWNEEQVSLREVLTLTDEKPLFGNKRAKTHWIVFLKDSWNYDCDGEAFIIRKSLCPDRESVPQWIIENDNLHPDCLNPVFGEHLSVSDVKDGWCKWQVRTDWENGDGEPKGGYVVEDYEPHTKRLDGKRKAGWFPVWIVRVGEWY